MQSSRRRIIGNDVQSMSQPRQSKFPVRTRMEMRTASVMTSVGLLWMYTRPHYLETVTATVQPTGNSRHWNVHSATLALNNELLCGAMFAHIPTTSRRHHRRMWTTTTRLTLKRKTLDQRRRPTKLLATCFVSTVTFSSRRQILTELITISTAREEADAMWAATTRRFDDVDGRLAAELASLISHTVALTILENLPI